MIFFINIASLHKRLFVLKKKFKLMGIVTQQYIMKKIRLMSSSIPVPTVLIIILLMILVSFPILHISAQQQDGVAGTTTVSQSLSELVNSVAILIGVVAPLIVSGLAYVKAKSQDPKIKEAMDTGIHVGQMATATANKALENKENIKELIDLGFKAAPEDVKKILEEKQAFIEKLNKEILATQAQIKRITPMIPGQANADTLADLPREKDF